MRLVLQKIGLAALTFLFFSAFDAPLHAQSKGLIRVDFHTAKRLQYVVWIESPTGEYLRTLALTESVARRGIGNRPGASQMNSGFRWPYGRREGVLPIWAHRRASAPDAKQFPRVIFQDRKSEGYASRTSSDASAEDYFCLSFDRALSSKAALDAVSCATPFSSDKGRYLLGQDQPYTEPFVTESGEQNRELPSYSLYPPRRDLMAVRGDDHPDILKFAGDALDVLPELDAITTATPAEGVLESILFSVPTAWPAGEYRVLIEANTEGDYNENYNAETYPTPSSSQWDSWAKTYGYPFRGQPSVLYSAGLEIGPVLTNASVVRPEGYGDLHGVDGAVRPLDGSITDAPDQAPGSGADRLLLRDGIRVSLSYSPQALCSGENPPPECEIVCQNDRECSEGFVCGEAGMCVGLCERDISPNPVGDLAVSIVEDERNSHRFADVMFMAPDQASPLSRYEVRVSFDPIVDEESFLAATPANAAVEEIEAVDVPLLVGEEVRFQIGGLLPNRQHYIGVRAIDSCNRRSEVVSTSVRTTEINYATVSPCFVATATYGTPMAENVQLLRRFRNDYLMHRRAGRAFVDAYYRVGPSFASLLEESPFLRRASRVFLAPIVRAVELFYGS